MLEYKHSNEICKNCVKMKEKRDLKSDCSGVTPFTNITLKCSGPSGPSGKLNVTFRVQRCSMILTFMCLTWLHGTSGFNLDVSSKIEFDGPHTGSYFGYTVAMMNQRGQDKWYVSFINRRPTFNILVKQNRPKGCTLMSRSIH